MTEMTTDLTLTAFPYKCAEGHRAELFLDVAIDRENDLLLAVEEKDHFVVCHDCRTVEHHDHLNEGGQAVVVTNTWRALALRRCFSLPLPVADRQCPCRFDPEKETARS